MRNIAWARKSRNAYFANDLDDGRTNVAAIHRNLKDGTLICEIRRPTLMQFGPGISRTNAHPVILPKGTRMAVAQRAVEAMLNLGLDNVPSGCRCTRCFE
jgi:hypothetical protein